MIISHLHKYVFVELPHTASTSISKELCNYYAGQPVLAKHSPYSRFLRVANAEEKSYFVFSCIRNPLDVVATEYFRLKSNHHGVYTNPKKWRKNKGGWVPDYQLEQFQFIQDNDADFASFFKKYYKTPYDSLSCLNHKGFDFVVRYENLQEGFAQVLQLLGIEKTRDLPLSNKTKEKKDFISYYLPEIQDQAKRVFGSYMEQWGYEFPPEWGEYSVPLLGQVEFFLYSVPRKLYWKYLKRYASPIQLRRGKYRQINSSRLESAN